MTSKRFHDQPSYSIDHQPDLSGQDKYEFMVGIIPGAVDSAFKNHALYVKQEDGYEHLRLYVPPTEEKSGDGIIDFLRSRDDAAGVQMTEMRFHSPQVLGYPSGFGDWNFILEDKPDGSHHLIPASRQGDGSLKPLPSPSDNDDSYDAYQRSRAFLENLRSAQTERSGIRGLAQRAGRLLLKGRNRSAGR